LPAIEFYDTTLRDGAQREGISFSVADKLNIARKLDELGLAYIEGGWPGSNPKDIEFFRQAKSLCLSRAQLAAFGSTRRPNTGVELDGNLQALLEADTPVVTLVGKSSAAQVAQVLETTGAENLAMIRESIVFLKAHGKRVFYDAEHYFDGYKDDPEYAQDTLQAAATAGADCIILCDTNGGALPEEISTAVGAARQFISIDLGIHAHNDGDLAVANSLAAVQAGVTQVQGTINGYGERCGNANLCSIIPTLQLKMGRECLSPLQLKQLTEVSRYVSEAANLAPDSFLPYVGVSAFSHKGGLHVAALYKWMGSYQHIDPALVGNQPRVVVSELSGKGNIFYKARELGMDIPEFGENARKLLEQIKQRENRGFQYDQAEASFAVLLRRLQPDYQPPFELVDFMVVVEKGRRLPVRITEAEEMLSEAMVKVRVGSEIRHTASEGEGPVNALDSALRKALLQYYPHLARVKLVDYKVRILEESVGTGSPVRVLIESTDGMTRWHTVGGSTNIIEASWLALADSLEYWLASHPSREVDPDNTTV
jgi:2-isopropylmalate synthase